MTLTPKTAAAGVVGIGGTAAAGYGVSKMVESTPKNLIEKAKDEGLIILTEDHQETLKQKWIEVSAADKQTIKNAFKDDANLTVDETSLTKFKEVVNACKLYGEKFKEKSDGFQTKLENYKFLCTFKLDKIKPATKADNSVWKHLEDGSFTVLGTEEADKQEWLKIFNKNFPTKNTLSEEDKLNLIKVECVTLGNKTIASLTDSDATFKDAVKKCTKLITLKERAESWGLKALKTDTREEGNSDKSSWESKKTDNKNTLDTTSTESSKNWQTLLDACKAEEGKTHFDNSFDSKWSDYLKGCMKDNEPTSNHATLITYKYWSKKAN